MSLYIQKVCTVALAVAAISLCVSPAFSQKSSTPESAKSKEAAPTSTTKSSAAKPAKTTAVSSGTAKQKAKSNSAAASKAGADDCCEEDAGKKPDRTEALKRGGTTPAQSGIMMPRTVNINARKFSVTGEVVDTWCFASKAVLNGRGPEHYKCADACAHGGVTLGVVDDQGTLYIAAKTKAYQGCQYLLEPFVARRVVATGWLSQAGGCNIMKIDKVALATDKPQPKIPGVK